MQPLPVSFFENLKTQKNAKIEKDEVIPFRFSKGFERKTQDKS